MKKRILIVEDEADIASALAIRLRNEDFIVTVADNGNDGLDLALEEDYDLAIIDIMLPGIDGLEIASRLQKLKKTSILILSARGEESDVVSGLNIGADDYVTKPFSAREVVARVHALLRRQNSQISAPNDNTSLDFARLSIKANSHLVVVDGNDVHTTPTEFRLLSILASRPREVFTREELVEKLAQPGIELDDKSSISNSHLRTVDSHVRSLRKKIGAHFIRTIHAIGYAFEPDDHTQESA